MNKKRVASQWLSSSCTAHSVVFLTCLICSATTAVHAIAFGESDTRTTEAEDGIEFSSVRRLPTETNTLTIKALTIDEYITQNSDNPDCSQNLNTIASFTQGERAQYSDFSSALREYTVTFGDGETEQRIPIDIVDDDVSELQERFVLFIADQPGCHTLIVRIVDNDELRFRFQSSDNLVFSEGDDGEETVTVVKEGENQQDVAFTMMFVFASAERDSDVTYTSLDLVFTRDKRSADVTFRIVDDTSPENTETFQICFPPINNNHPNVSLIRTATCKSIMILDDDALNIGFFNSTLSVREGDGPLDVMLGVIQQGLALTGSEIIQLTIMKGALIPGTEGELELSSLSSTLHLEMENDTIKATAVDDYLADGSHDFTLSLDLAMGHFGLPIVFVQQNITIQVLDNDPIIFELIGPKENFGQPVFLREGEMRDDVLSIRKLGNATFTYNVTLSVQASNSEEDGTDFVLQTSFIFAVNDELFVIPIEVIEDDIPEKLERFTVSISDITTVEESSGTIERTGDVDSIDFAIYDNDLVIGFDMDPTATPDAAGTNPGPEVVEGKNTTFNVSIFGLESDDIDPRISVPITFLVDGVNETEPFGFIVSPSMLILNTTNSKSSPTIIALNDDECLGERSYDLHVVVLSPNGTSSLEIDNPVITVTLMDNDCQSECVPCIVIPVVLILLAVVVLVILAPFLLWYCTKYRWHQYNVEKAEEKMPSKS